MRYNALTAVILATRPMFALSHAVAIVQAHLAVRALKAPDIHSALVCPVLPLPLGRETVPPVSCQRGANRFKGGGGLGATQCY